MLHTSMETLEYLDVKVVDACSSLAVTNPSIIIHQNVEELITPSWTINIKLPSIFPKFGHVVLRAWSLCVHIYLAKQ